MDLHQAELVDIQSLQRTTWDDANLSLSISILSFHETKARMMVYGSLSRLACFKTRLALLSSRFLHRTCFPSNWWIVSLARPTKKAGNINGSENCTGSPCVLVRCFGSGRVGSASSGRWCKSTGSAMRHPGVSCEKCCDTQRTGDWSLGGGDHRITV